jgi:hypothetical protein
MNSEQQELLDKSYGNFSNKAKGLNIYLEVNKDIVVVEGPVYNAHPRLLTQEEFINKCKTDSGFSERWGLRIDERELSLDEELEYMTGKVFSEEALTHQVNTPTQLITVTYNDKIIKSYE